MGFDRKYGQVTTANGEIPDDELVFVLRARDANSCPAISAYFELCKRNGSPQRHLDMIEQTYTAFADWQEAHSDRVRTPDSERSRAWMED